MASVTAIAGEGGGFVWVSSDVDVDVAGCAGDVGAGLGVERASLENFRAGGRLMRHCSSWWRSSALTAGRGKVPESARVG